MFSCSTCFFFNVFIHTIFPFHFSMNFSPGLCKYLEHVLKFTEVPACELREVLGGVSKPVILWAIYGDIAGISWDYIMIDIGYNAVRLQPTI